MGPLSTHSCTLAISILIECQVLSGEILDTLLIFDWQVSLAYAPTFLCILLLQYIFKLIPCSELSFRGSDLGPHKLANEDSRLRTQQKNPSWFIHQLANEDLRLRTQAKNHSWCINQLANDDSRLPTHAKNPSWFLYSQLVNEDSRLRTHAKNSSWKSWKKEDGQWSSKLQHFWEQPKHWEESWRLDETRCRSDSCERQSANANVKNPHHKISKCGQLA